MLKYNIIDQIKEYAKVNDVPIMSDSGIKYLTSFIKESNIKSILEIGTAIGYSAIMMCCVSDDITVTTIERDEKRYLEAIKNIKKMDMEDRIKHLPEELSGGQKQRVAIAGILALNCDVIILDEATSMLDPQGTKEITEIIEELQNNL